jgi:ribonuclease VapC
MIVVGTSAIIAIMMDEPERHAFNAYRRYGKGSGHPAGLTFGDCFAYALAKGSRCAATLQRR